MKVLLPAYIQRPNRLARHCHLTTFTLIHTAKEFYKYSFDSLAIVQWNALPKHVLCLPTNDSFKEAVLQPLYRMLYIYSYFNKPSSHSHILFVLISTYILACSASLPSMSERTRGSIWIQRERDNIKMFENAFVGLCKLFIRNRQS